MSWMAPVFDEIPGATQPATRASKSRRRRGGVGRGAGTEGFFVGLQIGARSRNLEPSGSAHQWPYMSCHGSQTSCVQSRTVDNSRSPQRIERGADSGTNPRPAHRLSTGYPHNI
jgi:hypothetical protein